MLRDVVVLGVGSCTGTAAIMDEVLSDDFWKKVDNYWSGNYIKEADIADTKLTRVEGKMAAVGCFGKVIAKAGAYELGSMFVTAAVLDMLHVN